MFLCRNFFLDFDGYGHLSSLEQNFNPSREDVKRKTALGKLLYIIIIIIIIISLFIVVCVCVCTCLCFRLPPTVERYADQIGRCGGPPSESLFSRGHDNPTVATGRPGQTVPPEFSLLSVSHPVSA